MAEDGSSMEVEVKARVEDLDEVRARLRELGADLVDQRREADVYFDHPERSFAETDEALRVRRQGSQTRLTYKGPRVDETTKTRKEIELAVADDERICSLLAALGFQASGEVAKQRETHRLRGMTVTLDQVDGLGSFVEVETVVQEDVDEAREAVLGLVEELGLTETERRSYLELLIEETARGPGDRSKDAGHEEGEEGEAG